MAEEYFSCGEEATRDKASAEKLHRFRIAAKNLRYTVDLFAPLYRTFQRWLNCPSHRRPDPHRQEATGMSTGPYHFGA